MPGAGTRQMVLLEPPFAASCATVYTAPSNGCVSGKLASWSCLHGESELEEARTTRRTANDFKRDR